MTKVRRDSRPLYILVKEKIDERITDGTYQPGDQLPSEAKLSEDLGVSRATLREALRILEKEGKVNRRQGVGTFITEQVALLKSGIGELSSNTETIETMGLKAGTADLRLELGQVDETIGEKFAEEESEELGIIQRTRTANDEVVVYCKDYLPQVYLPDNLNKEDLTESLFDFLEKQCDIYITYALTDIIPVSADEFLAQKLGIEIDSALLLLQQMHYNNQDKPLLYSKNYFRSDKFEFHVVRNRD